MGKKKKNALKGYGGGAADPRVALELNAAVFGDARSVFRNYEAQVERAEKQLRRAPADSWERRQAAEELSATRRRLASLKMMVAEQARQRDPGSVMRSVRGQGVPLLSNRHALPDDNQMTGI